MHALPFFLPYIVPLLTVIAHHSAQSWHALVPPLFVWVFIPLVDMYVGSPRVASAPLSRDVRHNLEAKFSFKLAVYLWCPVHFATLIWAASCVKHSQDAILSCRTLGLLWSVALIAAEGINCSHELMHRRSTFERFLAKFLLVSVLYAHFTIEHSRGHHKRVATPADPATLRFGESFYRFLPRTVLKGYASAWRLETDRLHRNSMSTFSLHNEMLQFLVAQFLMALFFWHCFDAPGLGLFLFQSCFAVMLLEQINAIEHYGLQRKLLPSGEYEPVGPRHSWDAPHSVSNYLLFKLQVHADHHLHAARRYQTLELTAGSPQLPAGYLTLAPLLLVPPLWRAVMDPVLASYQKQWQQADKYNDVMN